MWARFRVAARVPAGDDTGSTIPQVLGFFLIGLLMVAGAVLASDAYTSERDLQSTCDGAAIAAANSLDTAAARTHRLDGSLPLSDVQRAADSYLARGLDRTGITSRAGLSADGRTVTVDCRRRTKLAFGSIIGRGHGVDERASSTARSALG